MSERANGRPKRTRVLRVWYRVDEWDCVSLETFGGQHTYTQTHTIHLEHCISLFCVLMNAFLGPFHRLNDSKFATLLLVYDKFCRTHSRFISHFIPLATSPSLFEHFLSTDNNFLSLRNLSLSSVCSFSFVCSLVIILHFLFIFLLSISLDTR